MKNECRVWLFRSGRIYAIDTQKNPRGPSLHKVVEPEDILKKTGLAYPHTAHCLASGDILVSCLGDGNGNAEGSGFLLLDSEFNVKGRSLSHIHIQCTSTHTPFWHFQHKSMQFENCRHGFLWLSWFLSMLYLVLVLSGLVCFNFLLLLVSLFLVLTSCLLSYVQFLVFLINCIQLSCI